VWVANLGSNTVSEILAGQAPAFTTSTNATTFMVGAAGTFSFTASGEPAPTFSKTGTLPSGVTLSPSGVLSGTPAPGTGGIYPLTITASNGVSPDATLSFTLTVATPLTSLSARPQIVIFPPPSGVGLFRVSATLTSAGTPVAAEQVSFSVGKTALCSAPTGTNGTASCTLNLKGEIAVLLANSYTATFGGDSSYSGSTASTPAIVLGTPPVKHQ
jgi:hypothetical protein